MDTHLNNFGPRFRRLIEQREPLEKAYPKLGISRATLFNWLNRDDPPPGKAMLDKIRQYLGPDAAELLDSRPISAGGEHLHEDPAPHDPRFIRPNQVPVISWARAGAATSYEEIPKSWQRSIFTMCRHPGSFGIEVEGDSMAPEFRPGDVVVVMPEMEPRNHGPVVAKLKDDGVVLKIYTRSRDGATITLTSTNPAYAPLVLAPEDFHWIYPVHSATRGYWK